MARRLLGRIHALQRDLPVWLDCGNPAVKGYYSGELTIAAERDIIVESYLDPTRSKGLPGLIANNFVRIKHLNARAATGAHYR